jgi:hypothetical protein
MRMTATVLIAVVLHGRPWHIRMPAQRCRKVFRNDVGMDIDAMQHDQASFCT